MADVDWRKSPSVSKCTKNIVELVEFDSILLCLNFNIISSGSRCYVFLRKDHLSRECKAYVECFPCGGRHHVSFRESKGTMWETRAKGECTP